MKSTLLLLTLLLTAPLAAHADESLGRSPASLMDMPILASSDFALKKETISVTPEDAEPTGNLLPDVEIEVSGDDSPQD